MVVAAELVLLCERCHASCGIAQLTSRSVLCPRGLLSCAPFLVFSRPCPRHQLLTAVNVRNGDPSHVAVVYSNSTLLTGLTHPS